MKKSGISAQTRNNWLIDISLALSAFLAMLSGIYFLYFPVGGYQGGRNPFYGIIIFFERHTWEDLHTWGGIAMIAVASVHFLIHWNWFVAMIKRIWKELTGQCGCMNLRGKVNLTLNVLVGIAFLLTAISGIYFLFFPGGQHVISTGLLFSSATWDMIHTWSGVVLIIAAVLHFVIHWKWITKVTRSILNIAKRANQPITGDSLDRVVS